MNQAEIRGLVSSQPKMDMVKGNERLRFMMSVTSVLSVPEGIREIGKPSTAIIPVTAYDVAARKLQDVVRYGMYIHKIKGSIYTFSRHHQWCIVVSDFDLTNCDKAIEEYEPLNKVRVGGMIKKNFALGPFGKNEDPKKLFVISAFPDNKWDFDNQTNNAFIPCCAWGDMAVKADKLCESENNLYRVEGAIDTWSYYTGSKKRNVWSLVVDKITPKMARKE